MFLLILSFHFAAANFTDEQSRPAHSTVEVKTSIGLGAGVILNDELIITAAHVVGDDANVSLVLENGISVNGIVLWVDKTYDIAAVFPIPLGGLDGVRYLPASPIDCSYSPKVGEEVEAVGNPMGHLFVHSWGRIASAHFDTSEIPAWKSLYATDLSLLPGNSGGPVFDKYGHIIGIAVGVVTAPTGMFGGAALSGLSLVVPSKTVCDVIKYHQQP